MSLRTSHFQIIRPVLLLLLFLAGAGCSRPSHEQPGGTHALVDDLGRSVPFDGVPHRIISLAPSLTESLFAIGADSLVVGVTSVCNFPEEVSRLPVVGDLLAPDIERILSLDPDLVLISAEGNTQRTFAALQRMGVRLFVSNPRSIDGVCKTLHDLGLITGREEAAEHFIDSVRGLAARLEMEKTPEPPAMLMFVGTQPIMVAGGSTFLNEIIELAGARNAAASVEGNYPTLNREEVLRMNPSMLIFPDDMHLDVRDLVSRFPEWKRVAAVRDGRLHAVDADVFLRPGPRVFLAAEQLHALVLSTGKQ